MDNHAPRKGPFWLICEVNGDGGILPERILCYPVNQSEMTPSHKDVWNNYRGDIRKAWNYYPRGRVEIKRQKAIIYANGLCYQYSDLQRQLQSAFYLGEMPMVFKVDNSRHYTDGVFGNTNCRIKAFGK